MAQGWDHLDCQEQRTQLDARLQGALDAVRRGCYVFPIREFCKGGEGNYYVRSWAHNCSPSETDVMAWAREYPGCNWGIATGPSGLAVIDTDSPSADCYLELLGIEPTYTVRTPRGGHHRYYRGDIKTGSGAIASYVDTRGKGGYVLCPGSYVQGEDYEGAYVVVNPIAPVPVPAWIVAAAGATSERKPDRAVPLVEWDQPENIERARHYLTHQAPLAVQGNAGDLTTYRVACRCRDLAIARDTTLQLMSELWNPRCSPPWSCQGQDSLQTKVASAYATASDRPGNAVPPLVDLSLFRPLADTAAASPSKYPAMDVDPDWEDSDTAASYPDVPVNWIIEGMMPLQWDMSIMWAGDPGSGKSMTANQLLMCAASGVPWCNRPIQARPDIAVLMACEDGKPTVRRRIRAFVEAHPDAMKGAPYRVWYRKAHLNSIVQETPAGLVPGPFLAELRARLEELATARYDSKLICLDSLRNFYSASENIPANVYSFVNGYLEALGREHNVTWILLHHNAKAQGSTYAGTAAWPGAVRVHLHQRALDPETLGGAWELRTLKSNDSAVGFCQIGIWADGIMIGLDALANEAVRDKAVYDHILRCASQDDRILSVRRTGGVLNYLGDESIKLGGVTLSPKEVMDSVKRLAQAGLVEDVKGQKHGNGLRIVAPFQEAEGS